MKEDNKIRDTKTFIVLCKGKLHSIFILGPVDEIVKINEFSSCKHPLRLNCVIPMISAEHKSFV